jgi:hypothetical protein
VSIYATWLSIEHPEQWMAALQAQGVNAGVIGDDSAERELGSPWVYQGSHVLPSADDRRGGSIDVAAIPDHITRDGRDEGPHDWLRLSVDSEDSDTQHDGKPYVAGGRAVVVLDRRQVEELRDTLSAWLDAEER